MTTAYDKIIIDVDPGINMETTTTAIGLQLTINAGATNNVNWLIENFSEGGEFKVTLAPIAKSPA